MTPFVPLPSTGRIDLHSHLLPGIDDGCETSEESLACIRRLIEQGYVGAVCTPHVTRESFPENTPALIADEVVELQQAVADAGLAFQLWPGGEVRLTASTVAWLEEAGVPTLGQGRTVLVDYWGRSWPPYAMPTCRWLIDRGYDVLLAHPERMEFLPDELAKILAEVQELGVRLQGNLNSLAGHEGADALRWSQQLLTDGRYLALGSDVHGPDGIGSRIKGIERAIEWVGAERVVELLETAPRRMLGL